MVRWEDFGLRHRDRYESARTRPDVPHPRLVGVHRRGLESVGQPFVGITTDGEVIEGLFDDEKKTDTGPVLEAALHFVSTLTGDEVDRVVLPTGSADQRLWLNIQPNVFRHGLMLEDLAGPARQAALDVVRASYSARGFSTIRDVMGINGLLAEITGHPDMYGEWPYFFSFFGQPSADEPWSWQLDGHHVNLNCTVAGDRLRFTPTFLGSEPCRVNEGRLAGTEVFRLEQQVGLDMIRSLSRPQLNEALLTPLMERDPAKPMSGRMKFDAFRDNAVEPYAGIRADSLSDAQRNLLLKLVGTYVGWASDGPAADRMELVSQHLDETWFQWKGTTDDHGPFYYRVHSPVALVEFDHQPGVVFDNDTPSDHHIHTVLRTPNGGDYGFDILAHHLERNDHSHGTHEPR